MLETSRNRLIVVVSRAGASEMETSHAPSYGSPHHTDRSGRHAGVAPPAAVFQVVGLNLVVGLN